MTREERIRKLAYEYSLRYPKRTSKDNWYEAERVVLWQDKGKKILQDIIERGDVGQ
jgi:hypothetical protein